MRGRDERMEKKDSAYFDNLLKNSKASKKQVAVYLDEAKIERIDMVTKYFSVVSDAKSFSRNTLIELAIDKFLEDSIEYLRESQEIDIEALLKEERAKRFDTVIRSSKGRGFEDTFLGESEPPCWYPCRIGPEHEPYVKYIAIYRGAPVSAITHYAKVKEFRYDPDKKQKVCIFDGGPIELPHKIELGGRNACCFQGTKYTSLENLLNATKTDELVRA